MLPGVCFKREGIVVPPRLKTAPFASLFLLLAFIAGWLRMPATGFLLLQPDIGECPSFGSRDRLLLARLRVDGSVVLDGATVYRFELERQLEALFARRGVRLLFLDAAPGVEFGAVARVLDAAQAAGVDYVVPVTPGLQFRREACYQLRGLDAASGTAIEPASHVQPVPLWNWD